MARRIPAALRRRKYSQEPRCRFILVCEGERTEPEYFQAVGRLHAGALIELQIHGAAGVPLTIAESALRSSAEIRKAKKRDSFAENDRVWAIFDRDEHPNFDKAVTICQTAGIGVARSNPCFEVWLILHYCDYGRLDGRHAAQKRFAELHPGYDHRRNKGVCADQIVSEIEKAEARAEAQLRARADEGTPYGAPSTTVGQLTSSIREEAQKSVRK